jgi:peptidoglycan-associated lipoprotein
MKGVKRLTAFLVLVFISMNVMAQKNYAKDADKAFDNKQYYTAIELYKSAYSKEKNKEKKASMLFKTAECYRAIGDLKGQENYYNKAIKAKYPDPVAYLYLANSKKQQGKYDEALIEYQNYKKEVPSDPRGEDGAKSAELAQKWKDQPTRYKVENLAMVNSKELDFSPCFADKKYKTLYFTSTREGVTGGSTVDEGTGKVFSDIFETKVDKNGKWSTPTPIAEPINTAGNEGSSIVTVKGTTIFYTRCDVEKNEVKRCQLWMASKKGNNWGDPAKLPFSVDSFAFRHPAINKDENVLVFSSDMPGGQGGYDLWMSTFDKKKKEWTSPKNLGPSINTAGHEFFPFIHEDGTLYFSSDGHIGMGGLDIFKAEKKGESEWANVTNMRAPINSPGDDFGIIFEGTKERGYLSSNREGGKGADDLYSFVLPPLVFKLEGVVTDCQNKVPIENVTVNILGSDGYAQEVKTDKAGYYSVSIQPNLSYVVSTDAKTASKTTYAERYLNSSEKGKVTTVGEEESKNFKKDFCLTPATNEIRFPAVLYDLGKATLRPESKDSLNFLYQTLLDNPTIVIELSSHTDSRGNDASNFKLSDARAQSCVEYLVNEKHIPKERLVAKGYGETKLLVKDAEINKLKTTEEKEAAHQKNRRTVFKVLRWDYVDPNAPKVAPPLIRPKVKGEEADSSDVEEPTGTGTGTTQPNNGTVQPNNGTGTGTGTQPNNTGTKPNNTGTQPNNTGTKPNTGTQPNNTGTKPTTTQPNGTKPK